MSTDPTYDAPSVPSGPRAVLVGPPGAGKSTIGRRLAAALGVAIHDTDGEVEAEAGRTIAEIFAADGEAAFRELEERVVLEALRSQTGVVSLGGGAVLSHRTRAALRGHTVIYLEISVGEGLRRTGSHATRPLLAGADPRSAYRDLMRRRRPIYRGVATLRVRTDGRSPARVVAQILATIDPSNPAVAAAAERARTRSIASTDPAAPARRHRRRGGRTRGGIARSAASPTAAVPPDSATFPSPTVSRSPSPDVGDRQVPLPGPFPGRGPHPT